MKLSVSKSPQLVRSRLLLLVIGALLTTSSASLLGADPKLPRCEAIPIAEQQVSFQIDGCEKVRWNFGEAYPRPYFYPFYGPSGAMLTRMGHPGAPDHDHHQSIWFANNDVNGLNFWGNGEKTRIRQRQWYAYRDGDDEAIMASGLDWLDPAGKAVMQQELIVAILPLPEGEHALEIQTTFQVPASGESVRLARTNFAFLAVRVAKTISARFGNGKLSNSEALVGEKEIFAKRAKWMDYSGIVAVGQGQERQAVEEGITFYDHPSNRNHPTPWHVRDDGWMGAAVNLENGIELTSQSPLTLRYLLHAHRRGYDAATAARVFQDFAGRHAFELRKATQSNVQYEVRRMPQ